METRPLSIFFILSHMHETNKLLELVRVHCIVSGCQKCMVVFVVVVVVLLFFWGGGRGGGAVALLYIETGQSVKRFARFRNLKRQRLYWKIPNKNLHIKETSLLRAYIRSPF